MEAAQPVSSTPVWELSGWWRRVGATVIDGLLIGVIALIPAALLIFAVEGSFASFDNSSLDTGDAIVGIAALAMMLVIPTIYYCWMMPATNGQTVGKQALGIRVVRENGEAMTAGFAFTRQILVINMLFGVLGSFLYLPQLIDYLWPLWDSKNQALHDKIVKSRVVRELQVLPEPDRIPAQPYFNPGEQAPPPPAPPADTPYYGPLPTQPSGQAPFPVAPPSAPPPSPTPPPPPAPGGAPTPYTPPPGFENPVPDDKQ